MSEQGFLFHPWDRTGTGYPVELKISTCLNEINANWLFDYPMGLTPAHGQYLKSLFYAKFGHRQIGTLSANTFKHWVYERYAEIWTSQYRPLFESVLRVNLENYAQTEKWVDERNEDEGQTHKGYNQNQATTAAETNGSTSGKSSTQDKMNLDQLAHNESRDRSNESDIHTEQRADDVLFTDTPQTITLSNLANPAQDAATSPTPDPSVVAGTLNETWNGGYLTTATRNTHQEYDTDTITTDRQIVGVNGESTEQFSDRSMADSTEHQSFTGTTAQHIESNTYSRVSQRREAVSQTGQRNVLLADAMIKYRETLIPVERLFLKEFKHFFLTTY